MTPEFFFKHPNLQRKAGENLPTQMLKRQELMPENSCFLQINPEEAAWETTALYFPSRLC